MKEYIVSIYNHLETVIVNALFGMFWAYNYYAVILEDKLKTYDFVPGYFKTLLTSTNKLSEPNLNTWNCSMVANMSVKVPKLLEQYQHGSEAEYNDSIKKIDTEYTETLHIRKCENYRLSRLNVHGLVKDEFTEIPNLNNTRFLNIMYYNKQMTDPIKLVLDIEYIRNGNEILSKTFVLRMLSYQYNASDYVFDDSYELNIMDDKIQRHKLNASQYVFLNDRLKNGYEIRSLTPVTLVAPVADVSE